MDLTYSEVGATRDGDAAPAAGYRHVSRRALVGTGEAAFAVAAGALREWRMFKAAGLVVRASTPEVTEGADVTTGLGVGPLRLWIPCRVVWLVDEPTRFGFAYGTLPGHPQSGEEAFEVSLAADLRVWFDVRAFSRPATWYARLGGPLTRAIQDRVTDRYLRGLRRLVIDSRSG
jgi:uncharacterized protein (UPF0548 family)